MFVLGRMKRPSDREEEEEDDDEENEEESDIDDDDEDSVDIQATLASRRALSSPRSQRPLIKNRIRGLAR